MNTSLFYIRFIKPPPLKCMLYQPFNVVWAIESDLGDRPFGGQVKLSCQTNDPSITVHFLPLDTKKRKKGKDDTTLPLSNFDYQSYPYHGKVTRIALVPSNNNNNNNIHPKKIQLSLTLVPDQRTPAHNTTTIVSHPVWHDTYPLVRRLARQDGTTYDSKNVWLIPVWSMPIHVTPSPRGGGGKELNGVKDPPGGQQAQRMIMTSQGGGQLVSICEDVEQSIARHVWDCGLAMCDFIVRNKHQIKCQHVLELGSGTGLVGIVAALELQPHMTYLTDLPDALEIMQQNVDNVVDAGLINHGKIQAKVLSWGPKGNTDDDSNMDDMWMGDANELDLVLLTDVLYNQGSHDLLLQTLDWLLVNSSCRILLGYKERNPDERAFFTKISERRWQCIRATDDDDEYRPFEIYWIQKQV